MILLVDDDPTTLRLLEMILRRADETVVGVASGAEALVAVDEYDGAVDLVISDYRMPGMNGIELLAALRANPRTRETPVMMCTSASDRVTVSAAVRAGVQDYIIKPVVADVVLAKVHALLARRSPVLGPRTATMSRNRIDEQEYRALAWTTHQNLAAIEVELDRLHSRGGLDGNAGDGEGDAAATDVPGDRRVSLLDLADRLDHVAIIFEAVRVRNAVARLRAAESETARVHAQTLLGGEVVELRRALHRVLV